MQRFVILSGCSGGGKSTLLAELARRGFATIEEPGRRIVAEQQATGGSALPWLDLAAFARRAIEVATEDRDQAAVLPGWVFFDRSLIDAAAALHQADPAQGEPILSSLNTMHRYHPLVFMTPPWPEIFSSDDERRHGIEAAVAEYQRLLEIYPTLGYEPVLLPQASVSDRADVLLGHLPPLPAKD